MKRMVAGFALALALSGSAAFADGMVKAGPAYSAPTWSGFYIGAGAGGAAVVYDVDLGLGNFGGEGFFGTVTVGYDHQINSRWVVGIFADYDFGSNIKADSIFGVTGELKNTWAVGGRLGVQTSPTTLWYGTAGYTQAEVDLNIPIGVPTFSGYFLGLGAESQLGGGWSVKGEYRFSQFDSEDIIGVDVEPTIHSFRAVLSYKFGDRREEVRAPLK
jgi:outer membrane immunogenic protein